MSESQETGHQGGHRWAMVIDLDRCTGCQACVVACHAENNIPTVGPEEVQSGPGRDTGSGSSATGTVSTPICKARFIPIMCQQCRHAPCEPVCPVFATYHSDDGEPQHPGLQPLRGHALLRQQLPVRRRASSTGSIPTSLSR